MTILEQVKKRLEMFGYTIIEADELALNFVISKTEMYIKNFCNISEIPEQLNFVWVDMACGEFLFEKKSNGGLTLANLDLSSPAIKTISEGDTSVTYALGEGSATDEQKLNALIDFLLNNRTIQLYKFRRLAW